MFNGNWAYFPSEWLILIIQLFPNRKQSLTVLLCRLYPNLNSFLITSEPEYLLREPPASVAPSNLQEDTTNADIKANQTHRGVLFLAQLQRESDLLSSNACS